MNPSESRQDLLDNEARAPSVQSLNTGPREAPIEYSLGPIEKHFLLSAERGDCATVRRLLEEHKGHPENLDINCVDPLNRSALISAIENENIELIKILLDWGIKVKDALLHAIREEYVEAVEMLLDWEEQTHQAGQPYSWEAIESTGSNFTPDITPLILAAHMNNYEIIKILLDRGATLPSPHDARCGCDECVSSSDQDSLRHSRSRINAYRALSSPSLIALSSRDPLLTAFELSWELRNLSHMESEFRSEYNEMKEQCQVFATSLLDHARTSHELEVLLNFNPTGENWEPGERQTLDRLKLAIKYKQKQFVAHPNVQQLLAAIWYDGLPGFRRLTMIGQLIKVAKLGSMFPIYSSIYMMAPTSKMGLFMKKPFVKFICHSSSYAFFLTLLGAASQRVEYLAIELLGPDWMKEMLIEWKKHERGGIPGIVESFVIMYVISLVLHELQSLWSEGLLEYMSDLWNIVDFVQNVFYVIWIFMRLTAWFVVQREYWNGGDPWYPRDHWHVIDPMLISEGAFAAGMIFSFLKLVHIFSVNPHLGPLQISLGRMIIDIIKFFFIYTLVLFAFGCGMNQLMWYYADLEKSKCYHLPNGDLPDFDSQEKACSIWRRFANLFETSQSLFWASFGMVDLVSFDLTGIKAFTRFWALLLFGSYSVINVIVLLNMLIAMMSNSYQIISERSDTEWKFARSHLWMSYFEDGDTVPPPFNMVPTAKTFKKILTCGKAGRTTKSFIRKSRDKAQERHDTVIKLLVRRYVTAEQCKRDDFGITEDDVMEIRQDISTLRFELVDILRQNGMKTPTLDASEAALSGKKGRVMERRLQKDFQIGIVEGIVASVIQDQKEPKDVFSQLAKAIGKRGSESKKDWNAVVRQKSIVSDPIGSKSEALTRQTRRSLRRRQEQQTDSDLASLDPNRLVEYNPNLTDVTPTTRVAYAKFIMGRVKNVKINEGNEADGEDKKDDNKAGDKPMPPKRTSSKATISDAAASSSNSFKRGVLKASLSVTSQGGTTSDGRPLPSPIKEMPENDLSNKKQQDTTKSKDEKIDKKDAKVDVKEVTSEVKVDDKNKTSQVKSSISQEKQGEKQEKKDDSSSSSSMKKRIEIPKKKESSQDKKETSDDKKDNTQKKQEESQDKKDDKKDNSQAQSGSSQEKKSETSKDVKTTTATTSEKPEEPKKPEAETRARGKSKATGRVVGGWL
ncbi:hypothetical protein HCN44_006387 [Aphidius gifuensis]|uniref:Transient receptor ion channel domain-containing protein n=1 Tax=Aphidius gifuensis TaxID=684658 RepID=A0A834XVI2_APHGI|nr:transient receptor potential protein [Aphidius gifuensis]KAF7993327.1 hypothetical protein HCN44_006387 [Aphidius gifuensis]